MDQPIQSNLDELLQDTGQPCISVYMPTHRVGGRQPKENRLRLKRLTTVIGKRLGSSSPSKDAADTLAYLESLASQESLWNQTGAGLAIFASPRLKRVYKLERAAAEIASVGSDFYITPLLGHLDRLHFYVLAISRQMARLFEGSRSFLRPVSGANLPSGLGEITKYKETERATMFREGGGTGGDSRQPNSDELLYVRAIDEAVCKVAIHTYPLIVAAAEPLNGLFRKHSHFPKLSEKSIETNPAKLNLAQLQRHALNLIGEEADNEAIQTAAMFAQLASADPERVSVDPTEITRAARQGRVKTMLCLTSGAIQGDSRVFREHLGPERLLTSVYDNLADQAVRETLLHGGQAYSLPAEHFPAAASVAAVFRY